MCACVCLSPPHLQFRSPPHHSCQTSDLGEEREEGGGAGRQGLIGTHVTQRRGSVRLGKGNVKGASVTTQGLAYYTYPYRHHHLLSRKPTSGSVLKKKNIYINMCCLQMETLTGRATLEVFFYVGRVSRYYLMARFPYTVSLASVLEQIKV